MCHSRFFSALALKNKCMYIGEIVLSIRAIDRDIYDCSSLRHEVDSNVMVNSLSKSKNRHTHRERCENKSKFFACIDLLVRKAGKKIIKFKQALMKSLYVNRGPKDIVVCSKNSLVSVKLCKWIRKPKFVREHTVRLAWSWFQRFERKQQRIASRHHHRCTSGPCLYAHTHTTVEHILWTAVAVQLLLDLVGSVW